jgi:hypothetical protein
VILINLEVIHGLCQPDSAGQHLKYGVLAEEEAQNAAVIAITAAQGVLVAVMQCSKFQLHPALNTQSV